MSNHSARILHCEHGGRTGMSRVFDLLSNRNGVLQVLCRRIQVLYVGNGRGYLLSG